MNVLVTGAKGFVGRNLCLALKSLPSGFFKSHHPTGQQSDRSPVRVFEFDLDNTGEELDSWLSECDFVFHLAGVNRPKDPAEFKAGNTVFTEDMLEKLESRSRARRVSVPVLLSSSTQAALDNDYGKSKKAAEDAVFAYGEKTGAPVYVYRFANVFGKWCRPNYNSAVATWCYNVARNLPIQVRDPSAAVTLVYIDDLVDSLIARLSDWLVAKPIGSEPCRSPGDGQSRIPGGQAGETFGRGAILSVEPSYTRTLGEITDLIHSFHKEPETLMVPNQRDGFAKKLYATYLSYLPEDRFSYPVTMHCDARGSFTEILHTADCGQVSVNISKPGITKGQHWHHTKHEKFCVVKGVGVIQFRKMAGDCRADGLDNCQEPSHVIEYHVSGERMEVVRIPPGYVHNIINRGTDDMVTLMWANEIFDPARPDTFREEV